VIIGGLMDEKSLDGIGRLTLIEGEFPKSQNWKASFNADLEGF